jgi:hypothetical protein
MKTYLKSLLTATFVILAAAATANAQESNTNMKAFDQNLAFEQFENSLQRSDYPGIVESTLYTVVQCKDRFPEFDYSQLRDAVNEVTKKDGDMSLAYKAYLVSMYLSHSSDIQVTPFEYSNDHDQLFKQIADQLEAKFLAFNSDRKIAEKK